MILRIRQPGGIVRDTPNVPAAPAPLHGHGHAIVGHRITPAPGTAREARSAPPPLPESPEVAAYEARLRQWRLAARWYRARQREEAYQRWAEATA